MRAKSSIALLQSILGISLLLAIGFSCSPSRAQTTTGSIRGNVTDASGAIVPNVQVTATNVDTGITAQATTNDAGLYSLRALAIGNYQLSATSGSFAPYKSQTFPIDINQEATVNIVLQLGSAVQSVQVEGTVTPILNQENPVISTIVDSTTLSNMPIDGRNFMATTVAVPGVVHSGGTTTEQPSVNGARQESNAMFLDGMDIYDNIDGTGSKYLPNPDAIQQVSVITSNPAAEYSNANGGIIVAALKSGTNSFHGNAFFQLESHNMAANTWGNKHHAEVQGISPFTQSYFGGTFGGPIYKDKLFFFMDYQGYRYHYTGTLGSVSYSVAPSKFLSGDFSQLLRPILDSGAPNPYWNPKTSTGLQLYDSQNGYAPISCKNMLNIICPDRISPIATALANQSGFYPASNTAPTANTVAGSNFLAVQGNYNRSNQGDVKVDYKLSGVDLLSARYTKFHNENANTYNTNFEFPNGAGIADYTSVVFNEIHQVGANGVNQFLAGFGRAIQGGGFPTDASGSFGLSGNQKVGIPIPQSYQGFVNQTISGYSAIGASATPELYTENDFIYSDVFSLSHGKHLLKFGAQFLRYQQNFSYAGNGGVMGTMNYTGDFTKNPNIGAAAPGYSFADFVLGYVHDYDIPGSSSRFGQRQWRDGVFVQDDWKIMPNLTLNLGVRWDYFQPIYEENNKMANVDLTTGAISYAGVNGASRALYNPLYTLFSPRIGFAYSVTPRSVVRGGYGIVNYWEGMGANLRLTQNPPFNSEFNEQTDGQTPLSPTAGLPASTTTGTTYQAWDTNNRASAVQMFSLTVEHQLSNKTSIQVGYVGSTSQHLAIPVLASQLTAPGAPPRFPSLVPSSGAQITVKETRTGAMANYNGLQASYRVRAASGLDFTANYTYNKTMTNGTQGYDGLYGTAGGYYQQNSYDLGAEYSPSPLSAKHNLSGSLVYEIPFGRGKQYGSGVNRITDSLIGGWKVAGTASVYSGMPQTLGSPSNYGSKVLNTFFARPNHLRAMNIRNRSINNWFGTDLSAIGCTTNQDGSLSPGSILVNGETINGDISQCSYSTQSYTGFGTARSGSELGPGFKNIDLSGYKTFNITENQSIAFRADAFNAFNFANYGNPDSGVNDKNFGQISGTKGNQRFIQLALNYRF